MNFTIDLFRRYMPKGRHADIYGIILFTDVHAHIKKVLEDEIYWKALDEISGPQWAIFATKAATGKFYIPKSPEGNLSYMVHIWKEPESNKELLDTFGLKSTEDLPVIVVFTQDKEQRVLKNILKIDDSSQENAFNSIRQIISKVSQTLNKMDTAKMSNNIKVYDAVNSSLRIYKNWQIVKKGFEIWERFRALIP